MTRNTAHWLAAVAGLIVLALPSAPGAQIAYSPAQPLDGIAIVVEGDRLDVNGLPVRLYGIDAPDIGQTCQSRLGRTYDCGQAAREVLERLIGTRPVQCSIHSVLASEVQVGTCSVGGRDLGATMVLSGWAFPQRSLSGRYEVLEGRAQSARAGMWAGRAERPWIWRRRQAAIDPR